VLVIDWVKEESEEKYIRLYESEGALQFYLNWIIQERARARALSGIILFSEK
jgi:hypothetical protein